VRTTVGLDPVARREVWAHIRELQDRFGATVILTTHDMEEAEELCDLLVILHRGRLTGLGTPGDLKTRVGPEATLDDVFGHFTGGAITEGGTFRDVLRTRRTARRLG
jgi:ABC-2 type transport system ATP-binding protein